uniref:Ribosomal protein L34Ae n=1 Tax=Cucumis melo TaxID=3656 RepID=A0A9I9DQ91_CUCME
MKLLSNIQFCFLDNEPFFNVFVFILKTLLIFLCGLFPFFLRYFKYFKASDEKQPLFEDDDPFSVLTFRFPTYEEFLKTKENVDSNEKDILEQHCSIPSSPASDFILHSREGSENFSPNELDCTNDVGIEDDFFDSIETNKFDNEEDSEDDGFIKALQIHTMEAKANEKDFLEQHFSIPSIPAPDFFLHSREGSENLSPNDSDCTNDVDSIETNKFVNEEDSEDDDLIKALQIQIMKAKANAKAKSMLPSIPEETDYSITTNESDLKPWKKKQESFNHRDITKELHKFHKRYTEKMRKYDILNRQKTYAKELKMMQSKESVESVLTKGFCVCKGEKKSGGNRRRIDGEMEMVYVVQLWVSWEFIVWEYKKALEIYGREGYGSCRFNGVAEKFEHFKVMIERFMENEKIEEGSRVECYLRSRLVRRKLLQVPLLKEDEVKEEGFEEDNKENAVTIDRLINILQESIRILWQFIRKDKLVHISTNLKCHLEAKQEFTSPSHFDIQTQLLLDLQKKKRKLKKIVKRKKWMLKNCKEELEEDEPIDDELCFLTMVDLKLVSRMLNMKKITRKQLSWCHHKLSCITFPNGNIKIHPSSFLFSSS